ncbi:hypothetical protein RJ639_034087 [Escallonia herrerae]|uniref:Reverse transcriptase Ty1/copia-type domain-containing protein n=1 Tax=Escallonia herrerae TaxID=1293975 RepID=A0AA88WU32_9ASTE|nr:hypothetical protein RJ639_034087 [Escallonia herrerae]
MFNQAQINPPVIRSGTIAQKCIFLSALNSKVEKSNPWVIDSGASDHMTGDLSLFSSYSACSNNYKVRIAYGSLSTVSGIGSIVISPSITLDSVLLVPSLSCNLLSISKLTKDRKCVANFFPTHCTFQDQDSGKMIGNAKECAGLYLLKDGNLGENSATSKDEYQFWHLYNESTDSFPLISHINPENNTESTSQEEKSPPNFHIQNIGKWKNLVYSRKPRDNEVEHPILPEPYQDPNPSTVPAESSNIENSSDSILVPYHDLDIPIAQRKGVRSCTQHPISHIVSYDNLSPRYQAFVSRSHGKSQIEIPTSVQGAMANPKWKAAINEEISALNKNGDDYEEMNRLKTILAKEFEIKDLGKLKYFLGMEVARSNKGISISQRKYTLDLLNETGMLGCKPVNTPIDSTCKLGMKERSTPVDKRRYQRLVGKLIYLSHTRPDIAFSVSVRSKKQSVVSRSSAEAEFRAIALSICEGMWLKRLLEEVKITCEGSIKVFCDNQASINIAKNPVHYDRTKHVEIDRHFIREKIEGGIIQMVYIPSSHQAADILTKALPKVNFDNLNSKLGKINIYSQLDGE